MRDNNSPAITNANTLTIDMEGSDNGNGTLSGPAATSGAVAANFIQNGIGMFADIDISGTGNNVGTTQFGFDNTVGTIDVGGTDNQLGAYQNGEDNTIFVAAVTGSDNNIGIKQMDDDNEASVTVNGSSNGVFLSQDGGGATFADNSATVIVNGSNNGTFASYTPLSDAASLSLTSGYLLQTGENNSLMVDITGDDTAFSTFQDGDMNSITATVSGPGMGNEFAISQVGNVNVAVLNQTGVGNNAGISQ